MSAVTPVIARTLLALVRASREHVSRAEAAERDLNALRDHDPEAANDTIGLAERQRQQIDVLRSWNASLLRLLMERDRSIKRQTEIIARLRSERREAARATRRSAA